MNPLGDAKHHGSQLQRSLSAEEKMKLKNIKSSTQKLEVDHEIPLSYYYRMADDLINKATGFREEKNLVDLYITLVRFSSLLTETIPFHQEYQKVLPKERRIYKEKLVLVLHELESLKPEILLKVIDLRRPYPEDNFLHPYWGEDPGMEATTSPRQPEPSAPPIQYSTSFLYRSDSKVRDDNIKLDDDDNNKVVFKGLGPVEKAYIPYLEDVYQMQNSSMMCLKKRSQDYAGWALTALGKILQFLETTRVADMNDEACESLESLWDEVQAFKLDLAWLAPHVKFALSMRGYSEKLEMVKRLEEEEIVLKDEVKQLRAKLLEAEKRLSTVHGGLLDARKELGDKIIDTDSVPVLWEFFNLWQMGQNYFSKRLGYKRN